MNSLQLMETTVNLIESHIRNNIGSALSDVSTNRGDGAVSLEDPASYFRFVNATGFRTPAVFTIGEEFDFRIPENPNYIYGLAKINVAVVCEDKDSFLLTTKTWRYQAALSKILYQTTLDSLDGVVRLVTKVMRNTFSSIYPRDRNEEDPEEVFRKEVVVELEVEHYEKLQS